MQISEGKNREARREGEGGGGQEAGEIRVIASGIHLTYTYPKIRKRKGEDSHPIYT